MKSNKKLCLIIGGACVGAGLIGFALTLEGHDFLLLGIFTLIIGVIDIYTGWKS